MLRGRCLLLLRLLQCVPKALQGVLQQQNDAWYVRAREASAGQERAQSQQWQQHGMVTGQLL